MIHDRMCGNCKFYQDFDSKPGECRAAPPTAHCVGLKEDRAYTLSVWPEVASTDWCGNFTYWKDEGENDERDTEVQSKG